MANSRRSCAVAGRAGPAGMFPMVPMVSAPVVGAPLRGGCWRWTLRCAAAGRVEPASRPVSVGPAVGLGLAPVCCSTCVSSWAIRRCPARVAGENCPEANTMSCPHGIGEGVEITGRARRGLAGMHAHPGKIAAEPPLQVDAQRLGQGRACAGQRPVDARRGRCRSAGRCRKRWTSVGAALCGAALVDAVGGDEGSEAARA